MGEDCEGEGDEFAGGEVGDGNVDCQMPNAELVIVDLGLLAVHAILATGRVFRETARGLLRREFSYETIAHSRGRLLRNGGISGSRWGGLF